ncbi:4-alpha-glucanotransferase, partial [Sphingobium sp.]|uniref:4-alpha-glucanotransferase n=1 Tax=Sphingobium sp. TaxID=1912891 RepID=UPI002C60C166
PPGGGIRIDHAFGLQRLWVIPAGRPASEGAYLAYPFADLLRLIKLEAWRKGAIVIAEDLGTRPPGFGEKLEAAGLYGMAVLSFCRDEQGAFVPAADYPASAVAMSGTHDVATLAGWWTGRDLEWNRAIGRGGDSEAKRAKDCRVLWQAIGGDLPQPAVHDPAPMVDRALDYLAATPCPLLLVPMEDLIGLTEQPNIPGTIDEHPNWRRRLPDTIDALLTRPEVARRIHRLNEERGA